MNDRARSFFAVNFSLDVQDEITRILVSKIPSDGFGRTRVENLHLTLFFLGNISKEQVEQLKEKTLSLTQTNPFEMESNPRIFTRTLRLREPKARPLEVFEKPLKNFDPKNTPKKSSYEDSI